MNHRPIVLAFCVAVAAVGVHASDYYATAQGKTGNELRQALHSIIRNHTVISYSSSAPDTSDALKVLDEDPTDTNNVILLYAARSQPKDTFAMPGGWNREHCWPNSYGLDDRHPAYSDLHNLRAEDENVNSSRGNKYYDVRDTNALNYRFPAHAEAPLCSTDNDSWEPPAHVKGDLARAMFYMDVRYEGTSGEPDLVLTDRSFQIASTNAFMGRLGTLLVWHVADPVSDAERMRNERIYGAYQFNRNPFVDHPEWVDAIFRPRLRVTRHIRQASAAPNGGIPLPVWYEISWDASFSNAVLQFQYPGGWIDDETARTQRGSDWVVPIVPQFNPRRLYRLR